MDVAALLTDAFSRIPDVAREAVSGLSAEQLQARPGPDANPIGWLVWHLARVEDSHVADVAATDQLWADERWAASFGLEPNLDDHGYGHTTEQVASVRPRDAAAVLEYLDAVQSRTYEYVATLTPDDLDRIVDDSWDPPVTLGVRLVSVIDDCAQHAGQAAYVRGLLGF